MLTSKELIVQGTGKRTGKMTGGRSSSWRAQVTQVDTGSVAYGDMLGNMDRVALGCGIWACVRLRHLPSLNSLSSPKHIKRLGIVQVHCI